jgi:hypothetical protein
MFGLGLAALCQCMGKPKYWRSFPSPTPNQNFDVKFNWQEKDSAGTLKYWLQSKQHPRSWSMPII